MAHQPSQLSEEVLKTFEQVPDLYLILSPDLTILTASDAYLQATHAVREEIVGKYMFEAFPDNPMATEANAVNNLRCSLQEVLRSKQPHRMDLQHYDVPDAKQPGGFVEKHWLPLNTPVLDSQGQVLYIIHKVEDVTEMVLTEREKAREFRHLNDAQTIGHIGSFERDLTEDIVTCSNEWYRLHGLEPQSEPITVERMYAFFHPEDRQQTIQAIEHTLATGASLQLIGRIVRADGAVRYVQRTAEVLSNEKGAPYKIYGTVQDITEQVKARRELEEREALLRATEELAQLGSYELDIATMSIRFSDGLYRLFGEASQTFTPSLSFIDSRSHPEDVPVVRAILEQAISQKTPYEYTRHIYRADGAMRTLHAQGRVLSDSEGRTVKLIGLVQDVTDKQKAEQEVLQSKKLLQNVIDAPNIGIAVYKAMRSENGEVVDFVHEYTNRASVVMLGGQDFTGRLFTDHGENALLQMPQLTEVVETGKGNKYVRQADFRGRKAWFAITNSPLDGDRLVHTWEDVTEQKNAEEEILRLKDEIAQRAEEKYYTLFNTIEEGLAICSVVRNDEGEVVDICYQELNRALEQQTGLDRHSIMGRKLSEVFPKADAERWIQLYRSALKSGKPVTFEEYTDLLKHWYAVSVYPKGEELSIFYRDITERKQREQQQSFLIKLGDALHPLSDAREVQRVAMRVLGEHLNVDRAIYTEINIDEDWFEATDNYTSKSVQKVVGRFPFTVSGPPGEKLKKGENLIIHDVTAEVDDASKKAFFFMDVHALVAVPLIKQGKLVADLSVHQTTPRHWLHHEIELIQETAERTWAALERAKAEEALRQSEEKYRTLFDSMDEGYCIIQMLYDDAGTAIDFRYLQVNQAFERNTGLHNAEGKTIRELAPNIEPKWVSIYDQVAKTGVPLRFEEESEALQHVFSLYAFRIGNPDERKVAVIFADITERRQSQEALRQSEEQFRLFVTISSDIIYKMSADWSRMQELTGNGFLLDTEKPTNSWLDAYIPEEDKVLVSGTIQAAIQAKSAFQLEHRVNKADGTVGWVSSRAIPALDEQGNIREWFGTAVDISLRKQAEKQLHNLNESLEQQVAERTRELYESKRFAEQITEATPDFIMIFNLHTNMVEFVNQGPYSGNINRYHETLHIGYDQLMSRSHPEDRPKLDKFINGFRTASDQAAYTLEYRVIDQDKTIWYRSRGKVFRRDEAGVPTHYISVVQDISDLKQLEQENLKMRLDQQRTNLLAILDAQEEERRRISEGLHNGVGQILYAAKIHLNSYQQQQTKSQAVAALKQVDQILEQAIIETRTLSHELAPVILEQFGLQVAMNEICTSLSNRSMKIECRLRQVPDKLEKHLQVVIYRIAQELANNIVKHAEASQASISLSKQEDTLVLLAEDNGKGFDAQRIPKKGIGLQTIKDRVKLLNGIVTINSYPGNGTLIEISFPLSAASQGPG